MTLIEQVAALWHRLGPKGWSAVLAAHGLKIPAKVAPEKLARLLEKPLKVDRAVAGFEEFPADEARGVDPGRPSRSLLYYAMANPRVRGTSIAAYATPAELETLENHIFASRQCSLDDLRAEAATLTGLPRPMLAVVVFATEFRPASQTPHRRHADLCFSRTGVGRTGIAEPGYDPVERGFVYRHADDPADTIRSAPVRYSAWVAVAQRGSRDLCLPMGHNAMSDYAKEYAPPFLPPNRYATMFPPQLGDDDQRSFWVPLHKLFSGDECLRAGGQPLRLTVRLAACHVNDKLKKLFQWLQAPILAEEMNRPPFVETANLAEFSPVPEYGEGLLVPVPHAHLVAPAVTGDRFLTISVPPAADVRFMGALKTPQVPGPRGQYRTVPGYAHIRHEVRGGTVVNLNDAFPNPMELVQYITAGNYRAVAYRDYTADGWVEAVVSELAAELQERRAAYSIVTPPDFFPQIDQRRLMELKSEVDRAWPTPPLALSDIRVPVNVGLAGSAFDPADTTATTIVSMVEREEKKDSPAPAAFESPRHTPLPDDAAGIFHPGWDVGLTYNGVYEHLTNDTLGSPFPEDVKLCAAISSYWPGVVPDAARVFPPIMPNDQGRLIVKPILPTVIPMTDREIGMTAGSQAWDGSPPPKLIEDPQKSVVEYSSPIHADYISQSLVNGFSLVETAKLDFRGYRARVLAMQGVYKALGVKPGPPPDDDRTADPRALWLVYNFRDAEPADFAAAKKQPTGEPTYFVAIYEHDTVDPVPARPLRFRVALKNNIMRKFLASATEVVELP